MSKMKARRLILEADSSTESRAVASRGRFTVEAEAEMNMMREKDASMEKDLWTSAMSPTPVVPSRTTRKEKGKAIMTEEVPPGQDKVPLASIRMKTPFKRLDEVLAMSSDNEEELVALKKVVERAVEDVGGEIASVTLVSRQQAWEVCSCTNGSCVELVRNRTRAKVAATFTATAKERQDQATEAKYKVLWKRLAEKVEKRRYSKKTFEGLREDIENAKCATVHLWNRPEAFRIAYNAELQRVDEMTASSEKKQHEHAAELAEKMKDLAECKAAKISD
ncbi:hypothetical protein AXG93_3390s1020 [Marchantia polymorpha subsp. ruderalis]|uniref:Uncharacterized protein n=1 Tax=Marchantia polymorpha subsp. ruderalis TaxID=1480154 RepID=A0A176VRL6_MARPO|nr:hypothetical protein AXG93_3390s1020 [Marchantia polymorpha subsp. ruderalis]